jgi:rod shape-determining protein MreC
MRNYRQLRRLGAALLALSLLFALMSATARQRDGVTLLEEILAGMLYPLQVATDWTAYQARNIGLNLQELMVLREENARLRGEVERLAQFEAANELLSRQNQTLRRELGMREMSRHRLLTAEVIGRDPNNWFRTVVINRGRRDGVEQGMAVVNWQGLVGKVLSVTNYTATVQLLIDPGFGTDPGFAAGARTVGHELGYIVTQAGGVVRVRFVAREPKAEVGHPVYTSGQAVLPGDLLIGWIEQIGREAVLTYADIRPAVDFNKLNVVQVVLTGPPEREGEP